MKNILTIDLEDWYQGIETIEFSEWDSRSSSIEEETERLLALLGG